MMQQQEQKPSWHAAIAAEVVGWLAENRNR
jgi:hypothetical protein